MNRSKEGGFSSVGLGRRQALLRRSLIALLVFVQMFSGWGYVGLPHASAAATYVWEKYTVVTKPQYRTVQIGYQENQLTYFQYISGKTGLVLNPDTGDLSLSPTSVSYSDAGTFNGYSYDDNGGRLYSTYQTVYEMGWRNGRQAVIAKRNYKEDSQGFYGSSYYRQGYYEDVYASELGTPLKTRGVLQGTVTASTSTAYPNNGEAGGYWYVYKGLNNAPEILTYDTSALRTALTNRPSESTTTIKGTVRDLDGESLTVRATWISNGSTPDVVKTVAVTNTSTSQPFSISFNISDFPVGGSWSGLTVGVLDGKQAAARDTMTPLTINRTPLVYYDRYTQKTAVYGDVIDSYGEPSPNYANVWGYSSIRFDAGQNKLVTVGGQQNIANASPLYSLDAAPRYPNYPFEGSFTRITRSVGGGLIYSFERFTGTGQERGTLVTSNIAELDGVYPDNGVYSDGYWYVKKANTNRPPTATVSAQNVEVSKTTSTFGISGTVTDLDGDAVVVSANIGGFEKSVTVTGTTTAKPWTLTWASSELEEGFYPSIQVKAVDAQGNYNTYPYAGYVLVDKTSPTAPTLSVDPNKWTSETVTVTVEPGTDANYKGTYYSLDGVTFKEYTAPFEISSAGETTVTAYSEDTVGNQSGTVTENARISKVPPTLPTLTLNTLNWTNGAVTFNVSGSSSIAPVEYEYKVGDSDFKEGNTGTLDETGVYVITARARDAAGLLSDEVTATARIDKEKSKVTLTENGKDWGSENVSVGVQTEDEHSGVKTVEYAVTLGVEEPTSWSVLPEDGRVNVEGEGVWYVHVRVVDNAGNVTVFTSEAYKIQTPPQEVAAGFLVATPLSATEVELSWGGPSTSVTDGYSYTIRNMETGAEYPVAYPNLKVTDTAAVSGTSNAYTLVVRNHVGSVETTATALTYPAAPVGVQAQALSLTGEDMAFAFDAVLGADAYKVVVRSLQGGVVFSEQVTAPAATASGLTAGTRYTVEVSALNATGEGESSSIGFLTLPDMSGAFNSVLIGKDSVTLGWASVESALSYLLYGYSQDAVSVSDTTYRADGLEAGTDYAYQLSAVNETGEGEKTEPLELRTLPAKDETLRLTDVTTNALVATWQGVKGADQYEAQLLRGSDLLDTVTVSGNSAPFSGLDAGVAYTVKLTPLNASGSGESTVRTITTIPGVMSVVQNVGVTETSASFEYPSVDGATSYKFTVNGEEFITSNSPYTLSSLVGSTRYTVEIQAGNAQGYGEATTVEILTSPKAPTGLHVTEVTETSVTVEWDRDETASGYRVERDGLTSDLEGLSYTFDALEPGSAYTLRVKTINASGEGEYSSVQIMTKPSAPVVGDSSTTTTTAALAWGEVQGADHYEIVSDDEMVMFYTGNELETELQGLEDGKRYSMRAYAVNAYGLRSEPTSFTMVTQVAELVGFEPGEVTAESVMFVLPKTDKAITEFIVLRDGEEISRIEPNEERWVDTATGGKHHVYVYVNSGE